MRPVLGIVDEPDVHTTFPHLHETLLRADPSVIGQEDTIEQKLINAWQNNPEVTVHPVEPHKQGSGLSAVPFVLLQSGAAMHKQKLLYEPQSAPDVCLKDPAINSLY